MTRADAPTRRNFLKVGAVLAAPLAAAPALANDGARLTQLEDERALRDLHQTWLRSVNAGQGDKPKLTLLPACAEAEKIRNIVAQPAGPPDDIEIDASNATGRFHCTVEFETPITKNCTLAQMAYLQGGGFVRRTESRILTINYKKIRGAWSIVQVDLTDAQV